MMLFFCGLSYNLRSWLLRLLGRPGEGPFREGLEPLGNSPRRSIKARAYAQGTMADRCWSFAASAHLVNYNGRAQVEETSSMPANFVYISQSYTLDASLMTTKISAARRSCPWDR